MPPILWLNINFQYILLRFLPKKLTLRFCYILSTVFEIWGTILFWPYFLKVTPMLNHPQMFPSEWKMIFYGSHCWTETTPPTCHTHQPHPPATPTSHTHRHTYLLHPPATSISPMTHICAGWVCQVGVSDRCVRWACQVGVTHLPDTPTSHTYLLLLQPLPCVL